MKTVTLNVDDEFAALSEALKVLIIDIKAGKTALEDVKDVFAALVVAVDGFKNIAVDAKKVDNQVVLLKGILEALEPAPAP